MISTSTLLAQFWLLSNIEICTFSQCDQVENRRVGIAQDLLSGHCAVLIIPSTTVKY